MNTATAPSRNDSTRAITEPRLAPGLREALQLIFDKESQAPASQLYQRGLAFLTTYSKLIEDRSKNYVDELMGFYHQQKRAGVAGGLAPLSDNAYESIGLPQAIWDRIDEQNPIPHYKSHDNTWGKAEFRRDYTTWIQELHQQTLAAGSFTPETAGVVERLAGTVILKYGREVEAPKLSPKNHADDIAKLISFCDNTSFHLLQVCVSQLANSCGLPLSKAATILVDARLNDRGITVPNEVKERVTAWAKLNTKVHLAELSAADRQSVVTDLTKGFSALADAELRDIMEVKWITDVLSHLRAFERSQDEFEKSPFLGLFGATRLRGDEVRDLERALAEIDKLQLSNLALHVDHTAFTWPRIAEGLVLFAPESLTVHSDCIGAEHPGSIMPPALLFQRERSHLPIGLATSVAQTLDYETLHASGKPMRWESATQGHMLEGDATMSVRVEDGTRVASQVQKLLSLSQPPVFCFSLHDPKSTDAPTETPIAFAVIFKDVAGKVPGYTQHRFGTVLQLFVKDVRPELRTDTPVSPSIPADTLSTQEKKEPAPSPEQGASVKQQPPVAASEQRPARQQKPPPPPPQPKEPRPKISESHSVIAKAAVASIPDLQKRAHESNSAQPHVPFSDSVLSTTLHILKNGERPGGKSLKALRHYIGDDSNFRDCGPAANPVRNSLKTLLDELLE